MKSPVVAALLALAFIPVPQLPAAASLEELRAKAAATQNKDEAQKLWLQLAEKGDAEAQYEVGAHLRFGPVDYPGARAWFLKAAQQGHIKAMIQLGHLYTDEEPSEADLAEGLRWWKSAAAKGSDEAKSQLAMMQMYGTGMPEDRVQARATLTELAARKIDSAAHYLKLLDRLEAQEKSAAAEAAKVLAFAPELRAQAEGGDLKAMFALAEQMNNAEQPTDALTAEAKKWYRLAAERGLPEAEVTWFNIVALEYSDIEELKGAMTWLERAANRGFAPAQFRLAEYTLENNSPGPEFQAGLAWLKKAADQKFPAAMREYGMHLAWGEYLSRNFAEALRLYRGAAEAGSEQAQRELMEIYRDGTDRFDNQTDRNVEEALRWGRKSLRENQAESYREFGSSLLFSLGDPTPAMKAEGRQALAKAAELGDEKAKELLARLDPPAPAPVAVAAAPQIAVSAAAPEVAATPVAAPAEPSRAEEMRKLADEFDAFEEELAAAPNALARRDAVERLGFFLRDDLSSRVLDSQDSGEWTLRKLIPLMERYSSEAADWLNELPSTHVKLESIKAILPEGLLAVIKANAERTVANYQAKQAKMDIVRRESPAARSGDAKAQLAVGMAYLAMPNAREEEWADAIHWLRLAAENGAPGAGAEYKKLADDVQRRYRALAEAKNLEGIFKMNFQKAYSPAPDADKSALMAARILIGNPLPHAGMRARITNLLEIAAKAGNVDAMVERGRYHLGHPSVPISEEAALKWMKQAANAGNAEAKQWVELLEADLTVSERGARAAKLGGETIAARTEGSHSIIDFSGARPFFRYAAALGNGKGLAFMANEVLGTNPERALAMFRKAAELGSPQAMSFLGMAYRRGSGVPKDPVLARQWFVKAAEVGDGSDQYTAAYSLMSGEGGPADLAGAREYFLRGAERGNSSSMYELGVMSFDGRGVPKNAGEAFSWWSKAAEKGDPASKYRLAVLYRDGTGVAQDHAKARQLLEELVLSGHAVAKGTLEKLNAPSAGALSEMASAALVTLATKGEANAMFELAQRYETGDRMPQSYEKALGWFMKAADAGHAEARESVAELTRMEERVAAKKQAASTPRITVAAPSANATAAERELAGNAQVSLDTFLGTPAVATPESKPAAPATAASSGGNDAKVAPKIPTADALLSTARMFGRMGLHDDAQKTLIDAATHAEGASPKVRHELAVMVYQGSLGIPRNPARGLALLQSAADEGFVPAQIDLAQAWQGGQLGLKADPEKATTYFKKAAAAAEDSSVEGRYGVALLLVDGVPGVPADRERAGRLLKSAADAGFGPAQFHLGRILVAGLIGVPKDPTAGVDLLEKASAQKIHEATMLLAELYARGALVPQDLFKSEKWLLQAQSDGIKESEAWLKQVREEIHKRTAPSP